MFSVLLLSNSKTISRWVGAHGRPVSNMWQVSPRLSLLNPPLRKELLVWQGPFKCGGGTVASWSRHFGLRVCHWLLERILQWFWNFLASGPCILLTDAKDSRELLCSELYLPVFTVLELKTKNILCYKHKQAFNHWSPELRHQPVLQSL